ncbi:TrmH family RNA methyltransferase [Sedimentibacter sp. B4]|uniref:TrmH family RNA methyltransferase n=1 Tax=Sedimentibacter sp. B4 TaxID=304766 RepID=UPI0002EE44A1|nr:TrmH family RNA methyltransferase [Sedimentibacter sp. B4]
MEIKSYKKNFEHSYTFGMFPTVELITSRPNDVVKVLVSSSYRSDNSMDIFELCKKYNINTEINDKAINKISDKENCFVVGVFNKYECSLDQDQSHIVLVNPSNMGNMGTIIRTLIGFGLSNLAIISPGVDIFDPKVIRASMGALFKLNFKYYENFSDYQKAFNDHKVYTFMLDGAVSLKEIKHDEDRYFSLVFGNEATGLDSSFSKAGTSVFIKHTDRIDSLNLTIAAGIAMYHFLS